MPRTKKPNQFTQKELAYRWGVTERTVRRHIREFALQPDDYVGWQPVFDESAVMAMEKRRLNKRLKQQGRA